MRKSTRTWRRPRKNGEDLEKKPRISQSHWDQSESQVDQLTHQIKELQEVVNTMQDAQDFHDLETQLAQSPTTFNINSLFFF